MLIGYLSGLDGLILLARDFPRWFRKKKKFSSVGYITNILLTKLVRSRRLDIGLVRFGVFIDLEFL